MKIRDAYYRSLNRFNRVTHCRWAIHEIIFRYLMLTRPNRFWKRMGYGN